MESKLEKLTQQKTEMQKRVDSLKGIDHKAGRKKLTQEEKTSRIEERKKETKEQKFVRVVTPKIKTSIKNIRAINTIIDTKRYNMTKEQVTTIQEMLIKEINPMLTLFENRNKPRNKEDIIVNL